MKLKSNSRLFVCGKTGSGKSYFVINGIIPLLSSYVLFDYKGEHNSLKALYCHSIKELAPAIRNVPYIVFQPYDASGAVFNECCRLCYLKGNITLIIDEIGRYTTTSYIPKWLDMVLRMGRSRNVCLILCSQRPRFINNTIISECENFLIFRLNLESDRNKLKAIVGDEIEKISAAPKFTALSYSTDTDAVTLIKL